MNSRSVCRCSRDFENLFRFQSERCLLRVFNAVHSSFFIVALRARTSIDDSSGRASFASGQSAYARQNRFGSAASGNKVCDVVLLIALAIVYGASAHGPGAQVRVKLES